MTDSATQPSRRSAKQDLKRYVPEALQPVTEKQQDIPAIARDAGLMAEIEGAVRRIPTEHLIHLKDSRKMIGALDDGIHLVVTSPPYWTLKRYNETEGQLGHVTDYNRFLDSLDEVWSSCFERLVPGGRLICVVGDVCLSRRKNNGRHTVVPLHSSIQERCKRLGYDNLAPIIWHKISNANYEVEGAGGFLGKPYEPNAVIKNDIEYILMMRKPGGYRKPSPSERLLSVISSENYQLWFRQIWGDIGGASTRSHPAPFPLTLAERLVRMYSFVGDVVCDPFLGTGTTSLAAARWGRNSIGFEIDRAYFDMADRRLTQESSSFLSDISIKAIRDTT